MEEKEESELEKKKIRLEEAILTLEAQIAKVNLLKALLAEKQGQQTLSQFRWAYPFYPKRFALLEQALALVEELDLVQQLGEQLLRFGLFGCGCNKVFRNGAHFLSPTRSLRRSSRSSVKVTFFDFRCLCGAAVVRSPTANEPLAHRVGQWFTTMPLARASSVVSVLPKPCLILPTASRMVVSSSGVWAILEIQLCWVRPGRLKWIIQ